MATPFAELRCSCCPEHGGASPSLPDACAAYVLLQDAGDAANVHEWFRAFCELHAPAGAKGGNDDTRGARGGTKTRGMAPAPDDDDDGDAAAAAHLLSVLKLKRKLCGAGRTHRRDANVT